MMADGGCEKGTSEGEAEKEAAKLWTSANPIWKLHLRLSLLSMVDSI